MNLIKVNVIGLKDFRDKIKQADKNIKAGVAAELQAASMEFVALAKRDLSSQGGDRGTLLRSISYSQKDLMNYEVSANTYYAPFIEFGTKGKFDPYPGTEEFASQYKGVKQNSSLKLIDAIKAWVKRKNIGATYNIKTRRKVRQTKSDLDQIAFLIARSIYKNGIDPKPFFFKQIPIVSKNLYSRINKLLNGI